MPGFRWGSCPTVCKALEKCFYTVCFDSFFNSPTSVKKIFEKNTNGIRTVRSNRKQLPKMTDDKKIKRGDSTFFFSNKLVVYKWIDSWSVLLLLTALKDLIDLPTVQWREKGSKLKSAVTCLKIVKLYSDRMGVVDVMDQSMTSHRLKRKSSVPFYLRIFFGLIGIPWVNSYNIKNDDKLTLLAVPKNLIQWHQGRKRAVPLSQPYKRKIQCSFSNCDGSRLPEFQHTKNRCIYCASNGKENKTYITCMTWEVPVCLVLKIIYQKLWKTTAKLN